MLSSDDRVRGLWLSGSLARGTADGASDLDLLVAVRDEDHQAFVDTWRTWLGAITLTVVARRLPFPAGQPAAGFYSVTPGFERFDVVAEPESFLVTKQDRLEPHEQDRARAWGAELAGSTTSG